jgi:hypothetical protein
MICWAKSSSASVSESKYLFWNLFQARRLSGPAKAPTGRGARIAADK